MNILTCFKAVPDLDKMTDEDWDVKDLRVETKYVRNILNYFDESALELSLRLNDGAAALALPSSVTAMTVGTRKTDMFLKNLLALRFDRAVRFEYDGDLRFSPRSIAALCAGFARREGVDVLIMGRQSGVGDNAVTPFVTAEILGWPCVSEVTALEVIDGGRVACTSRIDGGVQELLVRLPCLFAVGDAQTTSLRIPTLKDKMQYGKRDIEIIEAPGVIGDEGFRLRDLARVDHSRSGTIVGGDTPREKARNLYEGYLKERMERL